MAGKYTEPTPKFSDIGWGLRICISKKFPGVACSAGLEDHTLRSTAVDEAQKLHFNKPHSPGDCHNGLKFENCSKTK